MSEKEKFTKKINEVYDLVHIINDLYENLSGSPRFHCMEKRYRGNVVDFGLYDYETKKIYWAHVFYYDRDREFTNMQNVLLRSISNTELKSIVSDGNNVYDDIERFEIFREALNKKYTSRLRT